MAFKKFKFLNFEKNDKFKKKLLNFEQRFQILE
jgi:hypothetical protein